MENTIQVQNIMKITSDVQADEVLEQIRDIRAEAKRFEMIANARIQNIQQQLDLQLKKLGNEEQLLIDQLRAYSIGIKFKETKTQKKYKLLAGELLIKKPTVKIEVLDREKLTQYAETSAQDYIKVKKDVDWAGLKKALDIDGDKIINKETGEVLSELEGLTVKEVGEIFDIKL
jgi:phage host-nuclease inhibitor protein Gam